MNNYMQVCNPRQEALLTAGNISNIFSNSLRNLLKVDQSACVSFHIPKIYKQSKSSVVN